MLGIFLAALQPDHGQASPSTIRLANGLTRAEPHELVVTPYLLTVDPSPPRSTQAVRTSSDGRGSSQFVHRDLRYPVSALAGLSCRSMAAG